MNLNSEQLKSKAHELALTHKVRSGKTASKRIWREIRTDIHELQTFVLNMRGENSDCAQPAEEWLLDHAEFIEEQTLETEHELKENAFHSLPVVSGGEPRILSICDHYLEVTDGHLEKESFVKYINHYQEVAVLTLSELWAIPIALRVALLRRLAQTKEAIQERRNICKKVDEMLADAEPAAFDAEKLMAALDKAGEKIPLSGPVIVHLIGHLREWAFDTATIREWVKCRLENDADSLEQIMSYEYKLQASLQMTIGNLIGSLRDLSRWNWRDAFKEVSFVEKTLMEEAAGDYPKLDITSRDTLRKRVETLAKRLHVPEKLLAEQAVLLANESFREQSAAQADPPARSAYVAYYLLDPEGIAALRRALKTCSRPRALPTNAIRRRAKVTYFNTLALFFAAFLGLFAIWIGGGGGLVSALDWITVLLLLSVPAAEWAVTATHWVIECCSRPRPLLRYDFSEGVPKEATTMVVIPVIWSSVEEVREMAERLELHYLANRDPNIRFALLGDFKDAQAQSMPEDTAIVQEARACIERLNRKYPDGAFHLLQRRRLWNESERKWMGWERKRGKLVELVQLLQGKPDTSYEIVTGDVSKFADVRYVITLDADTQLPIGSAWRMIGTMHLPYNRPRLNANKTRVVEGYGVLQPRIGISHEASLRSRLAQLWSHEPGVDPYAFAISDPYQDGFGEGIFTGKGIFDVETFAAVLCDRIPENRVLSHDLLEGGFLRAGLLSDIELIDSQPATFYAHQQRQHRWIRGDWQLLLWLFPRIHDRRGNLVPIDLSILTRWQIVDNLRRSLHAPLLFVIWVLAFTVLPGSSARWLAVLAVTWFLPVLRQLLTWRPTRSRLRGVIASFAQSAVALATLPYQTILAANAIIKTLYRLFISRRNLLEWVSSAEIERRSSKGNQPLLYGLYSGWILVAASLVAIWQAGDRFALMTAVPLALLWFVAPLIVRWLDQGVRDREVRFSDAEREQLLTLAKDIWQFYEDFVTDEDNWLPPDNVQFDPPNGIAHRTSPTNIGLYLACALAARDFGFIDTKGLVERLDRTVSTIERMEKWEGHLYNWYDTTTLKPLPPYYVSTVDSGNLVVSLIAVREGLEQWLALDGEGLTARELAAREQALRVAFAEELTPDLRTLDEESPESAANDAKDAEDAADGWKRKGLELLRRIDTIVRNTDFRPLYDRHTNLLSLGYHTRTRQRDTILYDLLASEARQASFVAIAMGQIPASHWNSLGRTMTRVGRRNVLLSWSGTMFEYLMPWMFMRTYRNTLWEKTYHAVVQRQIEYAKQREIPFGISESGYYEFDYRMNYQYRAFGVPGLGFKRGLEQDLVVAPYATLFALPFAQRETMASLKQLEQLGARGRYGFYEAVDFTPQRLPKGERYRIVQSFMAHHQGMSMLTLANMLLPYKMYDRFHRNKQVRAAELLLQERMPARPSLVRNPALRQIYKPAAQVERIVGMREFARPETAVPEVCVLSNGTYSVVVSTTGSGFSRFGRLNITRWREDPVSDPWGSAIYVHDLSSGRLWSPTYHPCRVAADEQRIRFAFDKATFTRTDGEVQTCLEIGVAPDFNAEIRRLTLTNTGEEARVLEVTTFAELALADPQTDNAHPAFSKLFVRTEFDADHECLIASRRPREEKDKPVWAAHALAVEGEMLGSIEFETDRVAFIGRGYGLARPKGLFSRLQGSLGSVADPAFVMRRRVRIAPGEKVRLFAVTVAGDTKQEVLDMVRRFYTDQAVERTFQLAWNRSQIEIRQLQLNVADALTAQTLAGRVLYVSPFSQERKQWVVNNRLGQSGLWAHGISGDRPLLAVRIKERIHLPFVVKLLTVHEYLRRLGVPFDLAIINESDGGYQQQLQDALRRAVEHGIPRFAVSEGDGTVAIIQKDQLPEEEWTLLLAVSRLVLKANGPSLRAQLRTATRRPPLAPKLQPVRPPVASDRFDVSTPVYDTSELLFYNSWGGFEKDGKSYRIVLRRDHPLPAPWINVMANPQFGCIVSERGSGYTWWKNSREFKLTPWSNDPVLDPPGEVCYVRDDDSGEVWQAAPAAVGTANNANETVETAEAKEGSGPEEPPYVTEHGWGYSRFHHERSGIEQQMTIFVPPEDAVKITRITLRNKSGSARRLSVTAYAEWVLGVMRHENAPFIVTEWDEEHQVLLACNTYQETFRGAHAFLGLFVPGTAADPGKDTGTSSQSSLNRSLTELSWTADREEFIGRNGTLAQPAALGRERLSGRTGAIYDPCGAVQARLELPPQGEVTVYLLLGCGHDRGQALALARKYRNAEMCEQAYRQTRAFWEHTLQQAVVDTPCKETNILLNGWLLYQSLSCRMWARTAFYQAGGAYGFRDQLQDSLSLMHTLPHLTRQQILLHAAHQYEEGDVQHWWHEETERGIRTLFTDDLLWLPYAVARYIDHTDDWSILDEVVPYIKSEPLQEGEWERYEQTIVSEQKGSVYEHCQRAIDKALSRVGEHGLPLIGVGDWNDGMNMVGAQGRGESVWLGWFLCDVLIRFARIAERKNDAALAVTYREWRDRFARAIDQHGWDGHWYRRAFTDDGRWIGSVENEECRIDAIAQSWSVISAAGDREKAEIAMDSFDRELVDRDLSVVRLLTPPFDKMTPSPGYIQGYPPGIRENGAQYTHGVIWGIVAFSKLGRGEQAYELFHMLNPLTHTRTPHEVRKYAGEPYVMAADVYTAPPHEGRAGWTWYTGSAGWMYQAGLEWILGIQRKGKRLFLRPCIPADWKEYTIRYRYGNTLYRIVVRNPSGQQTGVKALYINGVSVHTGNAYPSGALGGGTDIQQAYVELVDDGKEHLIEVTM